MAQVRDKKTGAIIEMPDEQLGAALLSGQYETDPQARVPVVSPLNTVGTMTADEFLKTGSGSGYRPASPAEFLEAQKQAKYGEGLAPVRAAAEGVARGALTEFVADPVMRALGADPQGLAERKARNPLAEMGGQFVGFGLPALIGGGVARGAAGAAQIGGKAAIQEAARAGAEGGLRQILTAGIKATPAALISRAARAMESGAAAAIGKSAAARTATSMAVTGLEGAIYGAGMGAGELARAGVTIQQVLDDPDMLAEAMLAGAKTGALWGAGGALALGGLAGALGAARRLGGEAVSGLRGGATVAEKDLSRLTAAEQIAVKAEKEAQPMMAERAVNERAAFRKLEGTQTDIAHEIGADASQLEVYYDKARNELTIARKIKTIKKAMAQDPPTLDATYIVAKTDEIVTGLKNTVDDIVNNPGMQLNIDDVRRVKNTLRPYLDPAVERIRKMAMSGPTAENLPDLYAELDQLKRRTQHTLSNLNNDYVIAPIDAHAEALRTHLLDPEAWGQSTVDIQSPANIAWERFIYSRRKYAEQILKRDYGPKSVARYREDLSIADPGKIESAVKSAGEKYQGEHVQLGPKWLTKHVPAQADLIQDLVTLYEGGPEMRAMAAEAQRLKARIIENMDKASTISTMAQAARERAEFLGQTLPGRMIQKAINAADAARQVADWAAIRTRTTNAINKNVGAFIKRAKVIEEEGLRRGKRLIGPAGAQVKERGPLSERFQQKLIEHERYDNEQQLAENMIASLGGMGEIAPTVAVSLVGVEMRKAQFLQSKRPVPLTRASDVFAHLQTRPRVCDGEMARYLRYSDAVENPMQVMKDFGNGRVSREGAEALRAVYPRLYGELEKAITDKIIDQKKALPYRQLIDLSILLDRPLHPSMEPGFIAASQKIYQGQTEEQRGLTPGNRRVPDMAKNQMTQSQRLSA